MAKRQKRVMVEEYKIRSFFLDSWLVRFEKRCFGWVYTGNREESHIKRNLTQKQLKYQCFFRPSPFTSNMLFKITELICKIFSSIRKILRYLVLPLLSLGVIVFILGMLGNLSEDMYMGLEAIGIGLLIYVLGLVVPTMIISGFGMLWRNIFKIDEKLRERLEASGVDPDYENWDNDYTKDNPADTQVKLPEEW